MFSVVMDRAAFGGAINLFVGIEIRFEPVAANGTLLFSDQHFIQFACVTFIKTAPATVGTKFACGEKVIRQIDVKSLSAVIAILNHNYTSKNVFNAFAFFSAFGVIPTG